MTEENKLNLILAKLEAMEARQNELLLEQRILYRQIEALFGLYQELDFIAPLANLRGWAASPDFLALQLATIRQAKPKIILELGSGQTSLISAYALQALGTGHVYALEDSPIFAESCRELLVQHGLSSYATIIHAPLQEYEIAGEFWQWYALDGLEALEKIDLLIVDGPPQAGKAGKNLRYPALPLLEKFLKADTLILMDDADREAESFIAERWSQEFPLELLRHYEREFAESEKGAKLFRFKS